eukprot:c31985_g1_i1 orf=12-188(-)
MWHSSALSTLTLRLTAIKIARNMKQSTSSSAMFCDTQSQEVLGISPYGKGPLSLSFSL